MLSPVNFERQQQMSKQDVQKLEAVQMLHRSDPLLLPACGPTEIVSRCGCDKEGSARQASGSFLVFQ